MTFGVWSREKGPVTRAQLVNAFYEHYERLGVRRVAPVPVTSGIDPSTLFVGSSISVLKPYISGRRIPVDGLALAQPAVRVHNARRLLEPGFRFEWGGTFTNIAVLTPYLEPGELLAHSVAFFLDTLGFDADDLRLRVTTADPDLWRLCQDAAGGVVHEADKEKLSYYRHTIGMPGVVGRNINFALRCRGLGGFRDVGNFILFEDSTDGYRFLEVGFGDTTILRAAHDLPHVLDCSPFPPAPADESEPAMLLRRLYEDCGAVVMTLWREGLRPSSKDASTKVLGKYVRALYDAVRRAGMSLEYLQDCLERYEQLSHGEVRAAPDVVAYLRDNRVRLERMIGHVRGEGRQ